MGNTEHSRNAARQWKLGKIMAKVQAPEWRKDQIPTEMIELKKQVEHLPLPNRQQDRKSTRLNSSHRCISYAVFCLKKKKKLITILMDVEVVLLCELGRHGIHGEVEIRPAAENELSHQTWDRLVCQTPSQARIPVHG